MVAIPARRERVMVIAIVVGIVARNVRVVMIRVVMPSGMMGAATRVTAGMMFTATVMAAAAVATATAGFNLSRRISQHECEREHQSETLFHQSTF
jgi:hypothetical protein